MDETIVRNENLGIEIYYDISTKDIVIDVIDEDVASEQLEGMSEGEFLEESGLEREGFLFVYGDEIGESDILILTDFVDYDSAGRVIDIGDVWIYEDYAEKDFIEELRKGKSVVFKNYEEPLKLNLFKLGGDKMKKVARDFRISVRDGEILGYTERGITAFRISEVAEGVYEAEDYLRGWISPKLDILGAWNLAQDVGITEEEFERAFGKLPTTRTVGYTEFVSWFFRAGQLPKSVLIDTGVGKNLLQVVIEDIVDNILYDLEERLSELGEKMDSNVAVNVVFDYIMNIGLNKVIDRMSYVEILWNILEPVFGNYIRINERYGTVTVDTREFFEFANTDEASMGLIEALRDVLFNYLYERYDVDRLVNLYREKIKRR